jgi:hypothetical protein
LSSDIDNRFTKVPKQITELRVRFYKSGDPLHDGGNGGKKLIGHVLSFPMDTPSTPICADVRRGCAYRPVAGNIASRHDAAHP